MYFLNLYSTQKRRKRQAAEPCSVIIANRDDLVSLGGPLSSEWNLFASHLPTLSRRSSRASLSSSVGSRPILAEHWIPDSDVCFTCIISIILYRDFLKQAMYSHIRAQYA